MSIAKHISKHLRDVHFGGNWTTSNLKDNVSGLSWQQATTRVHSFNTVATLVYHTGYYVDALIKVLEGEPLNAKDEYSFDHPPILSDEDWKNLLDRTWASAEHAASLIEVLPEARLFENFTDEKYGTYYRNLHGIIEHMHYHLGQIALIKKLL